jgi:hypothetical protein
MVIITILLVAVSFAMMGMLIEANTKAVNATPLRIVRPKHRSATKVMAKMQKRRAKAAQRGVEKNQPLRVVYSKEMQPGGSTIRGSPLVQNTS